MNRHPSPAAESPRDESAVLVRALRTRGLTLAEAARLAGRSHVRPEPGQRTRGVHRAMQGTRERGAA